jgi:calcium-dependent protein kinase
LPSVRGLTQLKGNK